MTEVRYAPKRDCAVQLDGFLSIYQNLLDDWRHYENSGAAPQLVAFVGFNSYQ